MKKLGAFLALIVSLCALNTFAQMPTAAKVQWDITRKHELKMSADKLWGVFHTPETLRQVTGGVYKSIEIRDPQTFPAIVLTRTDGSVRTENVMQDEQHNQLIALSRAKESLPEGIEAVETGIFISTADKGSSITWRIKIKGKAEAKKDLIAKENAELDAWVAGLTAIDK